MLETWREHLQQWTEQHALAWALQAALVGLIAVAAWTALVWLRRWGARGLGRLADRKQSRWLRLWADLLGRTHRVVLAIVALNGGFWFVIPPDPWPERLATIMGLALLAQGALWVNALINFWVEDVKQRRLQEDPATVTTLAGLGFVGKLLAYLLIFLLGWQVVTDQPPTALIAGLGVGGIAIGLAAQNILSDLFASMTIVLDKPFVIGDFIVVGDMMGTVEHIGLKSTRVRSLSGEQLVFSNQDLLSSRIRNYKRMFERRMVFRIGVTFQTPAEKLRAIPAMLREIIEAQPQTRFDRSHFVSYGDFALIFETVYYVLGPEYALAMDKQQAINLAIYERFAAEGIEFAYPTQTLYLVAQQPTGLSVGRPSLG